MLVSLNLLSLINKNIVNYSIEQLTNAFNALGIEVEQVLKHYQTHNLQLVKIIDFQKHPDSDHLNLVKVINEQTKQEHEIVCGAPNVEKNKYAILAPIGTKLWNGIEISERKIRGVVSKGMLCGFGELTNLVPKNYKDEGIILLDKQQIKHDDLLNLLGLDDLILDLSIPSNRSDLNNWLILLKELSMVLDFKDQLSSNLSLSLPADDKDLKISVDQSICDFYGLIKIKNDHLSLSWKLKEVLITFGYQVSNNYLDVINLFKIIYGYPINVYPVKDKHINIEVKKINSGDYKQKIGVYYNQELINTVAISSNEQNDNLVNCNELLIEIAHYNYVYLKQHYKLNEINQKYNLYFKNYSNWLNLKVFNDLVAKLDNKQMLTTTNFVGEKSISTNQTISFNLTSFNSFIGVNFKAKEITNILKLMGLSFHQTKDEYQINVPSYRLDLENQYDIFEELLKYIDINKLQPQPIYTNVLVNKPNQDYDLENKFATFLTNWGFVETKTYNLVNKNELNHFNLNKINQFYEILNPISLERQVYRTSLVDSLINVIKYNLSYKRLISCIFEFQSLQVTNEQFHKYLNILIVDNQYENRWNEVKFKTNLVNIKWLIKNLLALTNQPLDQIEFNQAKIENSNITSETYFEIKLNNQLIGYLFKLDHQYVKKQHDLEHGLFFVQLDFSLISQLNNDQLRINKVSKFPTITRDLNIELIDYSKIKQIIKAIKKEFSFIDECLIKDMFIKEQKYIYTLTVKIKNFDKTFNNNEINELVDQINKEINELK